MLRNILRCCLWQRDYFRCEELQLPIAFRYSHLDTSYSPLDTSYSRLNTSYSHLQLPVVVLKHLYNLSNHLATGYKYIEKRKWGVVVNDEYAMSDYAIVCVKGQQTPMSTNVHFKAQAIALTP